MKTSWRFAFLLILILVGGVVVNAWEYLGETPVSRKELKEFPKELGEWQQVGPDQQFDAATLSVLRASDYLMRNYRSTTGKGGNLYVGYYASQKDGATYHSPLNCLPDPDGPCRLRARLRSHPQESLRSRSQQVPDSKRRNERTYWSIGIRDVDGLLPASTGGRFTP